MNKIILDKEDFDFLDEFCKKYNVPEGEGLKNILAFIISSYKQYQKGIIIYCPKCNKKCIKMTELVDNLMYCPDCKLKTHIIFEKILGLKALKKDKHE